MSAEEIKIPNIADVSSEEYLAAAKREACAYLDRYQLAEAVASMGAAMKWRAQQEGKGPDTMDMLISSQTAIRRFGSRG